MSGTCGANISSEMVMNERVRVSLRLGHLPKLLQKYRLGIITSSYSICGIRAHSVMYSR